MRRTKGRVERSFFARIDLIPLFRDRLQASKVLTDVVDCTDPDESKKRKARRSSGSQQVVFHSSLLFTITSLQSIFSLAASLSLLVYTAIIPSDSPIRYNMNLNRTPSILPFPPSPPILSSFSSHHLLLSAHSNLSFLFLASLLHCFLFLFGDWLHDTQFTPRQRLCSNSFLNI